MSDRATVYIIAAVALAFAVVVVWVSMSTLADDDDSADDDTAGELGTPEPGVL